MELLASPAELALFLEEELDNARAELYLRLASGEVRAATGNDFDFVEDDEILLSGRGSTVLLVPHAPLVDVSELLEAFGTSSELELAGPDTSSPAFEWSEDGILRRIDGGVFRRRFRFYRLTCSHGFEVTPDEVKGVVLEIAGDGYLNPEGIRQETLGRYSYTVAGREAGVGLLASHEDALVPYAIGRRMRAGTPSS